MIKKFEEFVNEMNTYTSQATKDREFISYLYDMGVDRGTTTKILKEAQKVDFSYTPEEAEEIFNRLPNCDTLEKMVNTVLYTFFTSKHDEDGAYTYEWCEKTHCPIVRGINGKLLTGDVLYSSLLNEFGKDDEDFATSRVERRVYDILLERDPENAPLDDDLTSWFENNAWDYMDIKEINLDELFG